MYFNKIRILFVVILQSVLLFGQNTAPVAVNDTFFTTENSNILIFPINNDTDSNPNDQLSFTIVDDADFGQTSIQINNSMLYSANSCYTGTDMFTYEVCDNGSPILCDQAFVTIFIQDVPKPLANSDTFNLLFNDTIILDVLQNDIEFQNETLTAIPINQPANSTLIFENGVLKLLPNISNINLLYFFNYASCDACNNCDTTSVIINITGIGFNIAPVAQDDFAQINEDIGISIMPLTNDSDINNDPLTITNILQFPSNGNALIGNSNTTVLYNPDSNFFGTDTIVYQVCENVNNGLCTSARIIIDVLPVNDAPITVSDFVTLVQGNIAGINPIANDSDIENNTLVGISIVQSPVNGNATFITNDSLVYIPNFNFTGFDSLIYQVCDNGIPQQCSNEFIYFNVILGFIPPNAQNDFAAGLEDNNLIVSLTNNDINLIGDDTTITVLSNPLNGVLNQNNLQFNYLPNLNFNGLDSFQYQICNIFVGNTLCDTAWAILNIQNINDLPLANDDMDQTNENESIIIDVLQNDTEFDNDSLIINILSTSFGAANSVNGFIVYFPAVNFSGTDSIFYTLCDFGILNSCDTALVVVSVIPSNIAPVALNDNFSLNEDSENVILAVLANDSLVANTTAVFSILNNPANGTAFFDANNTIIYNPNLNFFGLDSLLYQVCYLNGFCDSALVFLNVLNVNDAPQANQDFEVISNGANVLIDVLANDIDIENNNLVVTIYQGPNNGSAVVAQNQIQYTPLNNFEGMDTIFYIICDNGVPMLCDSSSVIIEVLPNTNLAPIAVNDTLYICDNSSNSINFIQNDLDPNNDSLQWTILDSPLFGDIEIQPDGSLTYLPTSAQNTTDTIKYSLSDGVETVEGSIFVVLNTNNVVQSAFDDYFTLVNNTSISVLDNDITSGFEDLNIIIENNNSDLSINVNSNNNLTVTSMDQNQSQFNFYYLLCEQSFTNLCNTFCDTAQVFLFISYFSIENIFENVPNVITPNNDGKNDFFEIKGIESFPFNELKVFNRWGQLVFSQNNYQNNWNGVYKSTNIALKTGTYYFTLRILDNNDESHSKNGSLQIIK